MQNFIERLIALFLTLAAFILLLLPLLFTAIETGVFPLFLQPRVGKNGKIFTMYKILTIHPTTREMTILGTFLRKYKIDEIPQVMNVLCGTMSFVGPRALIEREVSPIYYAPRDENILPGITGLFQIFGNYNESERARMDRLYAREKSLSFDAEILFSTPYKILFPEKVNTLEKRVLLFYVINTIPMRHI